MVWGTVINGIGSLISLISVSLLVYRNPTDFCALILYPATLLNSYMSSSNFGLESFGFSTFSVISSAKSESLTTLPIWIPFTSFCCLIAENRTSGTMLNSGGDSGHPCCVPQFFPIENYIHCGLFVYGFYDIEVCSLYPYTVENFNQERMLYIAKCCFCIY